MDKDHLGDDKCVAYFCLGWLCKGLDLGNYGIKTVFSPVYRDDYRNRMDCFQWILVLYHPMDHT
jgi:hypothetical protein